VFVAVFRHIYARDFIFRIVFIMAAFGKRPNGSNLQSGDGPMIKSHISQLFLSFFLGEFKTSSHFVHKGQIACPGFLGSFSFLFILGLLDHLFEALHDDFFVITGMRGIDLAQGFCEI
jgi:hypothetical protein